MAPRFLHVHLHAREEEAPQGVAGEPDPGSVRLGMRETERRTGFIDDESAARFFLGQILGTEARAGLRGIAAPDSPAVVPDLRLQQVQDSPLTGTRVVTFDQVRTSIPVFGTRAVVELDKERQLLGINAALTEAPDVSPAPTLSPAQGLEEIARLTGVAIDSAAVGPPSLTFFQSEEDEAWHLAYLFEEVPAAPADMLEHPEGGAHRHGHGLGASPREDQPLVNYLVDAHSGEVLFHYSATPFVTAAPGPLPAKCRGVDEDGAMHELFGREVPGGGFELLDPARSIRTYDLQGEDLEDASMFPADAVRHGSFDFGTHHKAAVSAHVNAARVYDFYNDVLKRNGIDDQGMELVSVINCTYPRKQAKPEWHNAVWWKDRMWYGQMRADTGALVSYSRFLDVIAHELTHGVTETSSDLIYKDQSGALNESFSDIFGAVIKNWTVKGPDSDPRTWDWELGPGLGDNGLPLRDLSDPTRTGDPAHMADFVITPFDGGGVHTNSNIHNKAAFNLLTAQDETGKLAIPPREVAILYYLTLVRLSKLATFQEALLLLLDVARTFYPDPAERGRKLQAIRDAYAAVGIP